MTEAPLTQNQAVQQTVVKDETADDRVGKVQTLYSVSYFHVFMRNFAAGFARSLGSLFIWILMLVISSYFFVTYVWPEIRPFASGMQNALSTISGGSGVDKLPRFDLSPTPVPPPTNP
jgi:hypothetical protein